jgi:Na+-transporting NADH:ubiquinone oxidoreductase subunit NqrC
MNLLQTFDRAFCNGIDQFTLKKSVCFLATLPINGIIAIGKPIQKVSSLIDKNDYLAAMTQSVVDSSRIKQLISNALTDKIEDREVFMKGIDYSYYYEQVDE